MLAQVGKKSMPSLETFLDGKPKKVRRRRNGRPDPAEIAAKMKAFHERARAAREKSNP